LTFSGLVVQSSCVIVDIYFISSLGAQSTAGVSAASTVAFITIALAQVVGVGALSLSAQAAGRRDRGKLSAIFRQSLLFAITCAAGVLALGYALLKRYMDAMTPDIDTSAAGTAYLYWCLPGLALHLAVAAVEGVLRGIGRVLPIVMSQGLTVAINIVLAPVLVVGWLTGRPLGVSGAGLATSLSIGVGAIAIMLYLWNSHRYLWQRPESLRWSLWPASIRVGLPAGADAMLGYVATAVITWALAYFGSDAQAAYGIGSRITQALSLPLIAFGSALVTVGGQNVGAKIRSRVERAVGWTLLFCALCAVSSIVLCRRYAEFLIGSFSPDQAVISFGAAYLRVLSLSFVPYAIVSTCSSLFQALGTTVQPFLCSATRVLCYVGPVIWLSQSGRARVDDLWFVSVVSAVLQAFLIAILARRTWRHVACAWSASGEFPTGHGQ
jgi:putative MATE family efflux protein